MSDLRQQVRRDEDLPPMARLLFAEIWQMNEGDCECYAEDEWLGEQIGAAESTVRKHRLTLRQKGYIKQSKSGGRRYLEPNKMINIDHTDQQQSESTVNDDQSDQNRSGKVINSDQHRDNNNPEGTSEGARAREGGPDTSRDDDPPGVRIWTDVTGERPNISTRQELKDAFSGPDAPRWDDDIFRKTLREAYLNVSRDAHRIRVGYLLTSYEQHLARGGDSVPDPNVEFNARGYKIR